LSKDDVTYGAWAMRSLMSVQHWQQTWTQIYNTNTNTEPLTHQKSIYTWLNLSSASEMTCIVSSGALNSTHSLAKPICVCVVYS